MDVLTREQRHRNMSNIRSSGTKAELAIADILKKNGYRFHLNDKKLVGKPDVVLAKNRQVIFINGCFWHMHNCRFGKVIPKTNAEFWKLKRESNRARDRRVIKALKAAKWQPLVIWECQIKGNLSAVEKKLIKSLGKIYDKKRR